jgi:hypothetical protein
MRGFSDGWGKRGDFQTTGGEHEKVDNYYIDRQHIMINISLGKTLSSPRVESTSDTPPSDDLFKIENMSINNCKFQVHTNSHLASQKSCQSPTEAILGARSSLATREFGQCGYKCVPLLWATIHRLVHFPILHVSFIPCLCFRMYYSW